VTAKAELEHGSVPERKSGVLMLVGTPIGNLGDLAPRAVEALRAADVIAAEDTRRTRALLTHAGIAAGGRLRSVHAHNEQESAASVVHAVRDGKRVAYVTDAGMPGISDPGARLVRACIDADLAVEVVPGPSAALSALVLSGFPTERFVFEGFLPRKGRDRRERLASVVSDDRTTILFESPRRVAATLTDLLVLCGPTREVAVARELTKLFEDVWRGTLGDAEALVATGAPRGEHVIVLSPVPPAPAANDDEIEAHVRAALNEGLRARDAAARVAADLGVPRRRAYDVAISLRKR
jgi:16S rRNA (cytidine1402-2'-O)-methyltransferase